MSDWITDRLPCKRDADDEGRVLVTMYQPEPKVFSVMYFHVAPNQPWQRIPKWPKPYIKPKRWGIGNVGCYPCVLENGHVALVIQKSTAEASEVAKLIANTLNKEMP